jgi:hypothetical protein
MKKITLAIVLSFGLIAGHSQTVEFKGNSGIEFKDANGKTTGRIGSVGPDLKDTTAVIPPADSLAFISAVDLVRFSQLLSKISVEEYRMLTPEATIANLYRWSVLLWNEDRKQKQKNKKGQ